jgi:hypothetical protein
MSSMSITQRLGVIQNLLAQLGQYQILRKSQMPYHVFELYCYFRKAKELMDRGKLPIFRNPQGNVFAFHAKPGKPKTASYITFYDQNGEDMNLFLNAEFPGRSKVLHSPDMILTSSKNDEIASIYECKHLSGNLELDIYREFIGYCEEMGLLVRKKNTKSEFIEIPIMN